jgi:hypothetical protein
MNKDKVGELFRYPNASLLLLGYAKLISFAIYTTGRITYVYTKWKLPFVPDYNIISRRINRLDVKIKDNKSTEFKDDYIVIAIDITSIKITNRDQWMR